MKTNKWEKLQEFQNEHKDLLIMFADPKDDAVSVSFGGLNGFVRFPKPESMDKGVVYNALRESKFNEAIDAFMAGFAEGTGIKPDTADGLQIHHILGGTMKSIGKSRGRIIKNKEKTNGKK